MDKKGLTIIEVLVASAIMMIVIAGCSTFYLMARDTWAKCSLQMPLQRKARLAMEKLVRGERAFGDNRHNGLREAQDVEKKSAAEIWFKSGVDEVERSFYLSGNILWYDPDTDHTNRNEVEIIDKVSSLNFSFPSAVTDPELVRIDLSLQDNTVSVALQTEVRCRN